MSSQMKKSRGKTVGMIFATVLFLAMVSAMDSYADYSAIFQEVVEPKHLKLTSQKSVILKSRMPIKRVSIAAPEVADFLLLSPNEIYLTGKAAGTTNMTLWDKNGVLAVYDLDVSYDTAKLKEQIHQMFPEEQDLKVMTTNTTIVLSGRVSSASILSQVVNLAKAYAPEGKINNLVNVGGIHQVMLEVRVAEMSKNLNKRLGINWNYVDGEEFGISTLGALTELTSPDDANIGSGGPFGILVSPAVNALFRFSAGGIPWTAFIDALKEDGLVKILAEPTLIALSGQTANFLAGGEFPVPVPQGLGTVAVEYKPFGVGLAFSPTVLDKNKINIQVTPEVSELDFSTAIRFTGFVVPGISTRRATTTIELDEGQSFAIAGLLKDTIRENITKFPFLGDLPILGALFRSSSFQKNETELIIIVTPHLVKPLNMAKQSLPTDNYIEPNDLEFYFEGLLEGRPKENSLSKNPSLDGEFGHEIPAN